MRVHGVGTFRFAALGAAVLLQTGCMSKATQTGTGCSSAARQANMFRAGQPDDCGSGNGNGVGSTSATGTSYDTSSGTSLSDGSSGGTSGDTSSGGVTQGTSAGNGAGNAGNGGNPFGPGGPLAGLDPNQFFASLVQKFGNLANVPASVWAAIREYLSGMGGIGGSGAGGTIEREAALVVSAGGADNEQDPSAQLGGGPHVKLYMLQDQGGTTSPVEGASFFAYDQNWRGGVRSAVGDVDGDGLVDIVTAPGPGGGPHVKIFSAAGQELCSFWGLDPSFTGGLFVAVADVDGDLNTGRAEIIIGAGYGGGPAVLVYRVDPKNGGCNQQLMAAFFAFEDTFRGGVRVGAGDVNNDGFADIITGAGFGGGPRVDVFSGAKIAAGQVGDAARLNAFFAFETEFTGGVYVAATDFDGDAHADIVVGAGRTGGPRVAVISGATGARLVDKWAYDTSVTSGVRVGGGLATDDELYLDYATSAGPGGGPHVKAWHGGNDQLILNFMAFDPNFRGGTYLNFVAPGGL